MSDPRPATTQELRDHELGRPSPWKDLAGYLAWRRPEEKRNES